MRVLGLDHVAIVVTDVDAALAFYVDLLGLSTSSKRPPLPFRGAWLEVGAQQIHLIEGPDPRAGDGHFALTVDDLHGYVVRLRAAGFEVKGPPPMGPPQFLVRDPSGNGVELRGTR